MRANLFSNLLNELRKNIRCKALMGILCVCFFAIDLINECMVLFIIALKCHFICDFVVKRDFPPEVNATSFNKDATALLKGSYHAICILNP